MDLFKNPMKENVDLKDQMTIFDEEDKKMGKDVESRTVDGFVFNSKEDADFYRENAELLIGEIMFADKNLLSPAGMVNVMMPYFRNQDFVDMIEMKIKSSAKEFVGDCYEANYSLEQMSNTVLDVLSKSMFSLGLVVAAANSIHGKREKNGSPIQPKGTNLSLEEYLKVGAEIVDNYDVLVPERDM